MAQQLNLYDISLRPQRHLLTPLRLLVAVLLLWVLMALVGQGLRRDAERLRAEAHADAEQMQALIKSQAELAQDDGGLPALRQQVAEARQLVHALRPAEDGPADQSAQVLAALSAAAGPEVWVSALQWQGSPRQLALEGGLLKANQLPAYLRRLERQPVFAGQSFAQVQLQPSGPGLPPHHRFVLRSQPKEGGR